MTIRYRLPVGSVYFDSCYTYDISALYMTSCYVYLCIACTLYNTQLSYIQLQQYLSARSHNRMSTFCRHELWPSKFKDWTVMCNLPFYCVTYNFLNIQHQGCSIRVLEHQRWHLVIRGFWIIYIPVMNLHRSWVTEAVKLVSLNVKWWYDMIRISECHVIASYYIICQFSIVRWMLMRNT